MMKPKYTTPVLRKGKEVTSIAKGSNKRIEEAKQTWYIEYYFESKRIRVTRNLNRVKDHKEKEFEFDCLLESIKNDLRDGYNPLNETQFIEDKLKQDITVTKALEVFINYHLSHYTTTATIATYQSKLKHFIEFVGGETKLSNVTTKHLEDFVHSKIRSGTYTNKSVSLAKRTFSTFYNVLSELGYYTSNNPTAKFDKKIKSMKDTKELHKTYTLQQLNQIMNWLDENDKFTALFVRVQFHSCIRPKELRSLKVSDINLQDKTIKVRLSVKKDTKNVKNDIVSINKQLMQHLQTLELDMQDKNNYVFGDTQNFFSPTQIGKNTVYNRFIKCLKALKLHNQGYDLYSIKHTSNILKYKQGWSTEQIMKVNRHASVKQTETYLRDLTNQTDVSEMDMPAI